MSFLLFYATSALLVASGESRGVKTDEEVAVVCNVLLNRALRTNKDTISSVAALDEVAKSPWQFSAWNDNDPNKPVITNEKHTSTKGYKRVESVCRLTWQGRIEGWMIDTTYGADHYYSGDKVPYWAKGKKGIRVGAFIHFNLWPESKNERRLNKLAEKTPPQQALDKLFLYLEGETK